MKTEEEIKELIKAKEDELEGLKEALKIKQGKYPKLKDWGI